MLEGARSECGPAQALPTGGRDRSRHCTGDSREPCDTGHRRHEPDEAQAEQVRSVSVHRITEAIGRVAVDRMFRLDEALRLHLAL